MNEYMIKKVLYTVLLSILFLWIPGREYDIFAAESTEKVAGYAYEYSDWSDYDLTEKDFTVVKDRIASISLTGEINKSTQYGKVPGYGISGGNVSFSLDYDGKWQNESERKYLLEDSGKKINGQKIDAKLGKGALMLQKSSNGRTWQLAANPIVNVFGSGKRNLKNFYTTSGNDINKGCYYRIIIAYRYEAVEDGSLNLGFHNFSYDDEEDYKVAEVYKFFICNNSGNVSLHNLAADDSSIPDDIGEGITAEAILKGETLLDGSATTKGFTIDTLGIEYRSIRVNGNTSKDGARFEEPGRYTIDLTTKLDDVITKTVFIYDGGEDRGYFNYFGENLISGNRVFREGDYPSYGKGSVAKIKTPEDNVPSVSGTIKNITLGKVINVPNDRKSHSYNLDAGEYQADLFSGNVEAGSVIHYVIRFNILDEGSKPCVNYNKLMSTERVCDLNTGHYEVVYPTTRGGYIFVCFESEDEAFKYAYDIEKRFIENKDERIHYKALDNSNEKVVYPTETNQNKLDLTFAINKYARQNVEKAYFDATETFTYQTYGDGDDLLDSLEKMSIADSIRVFPTEEEREKLIKRMPYLNKFTFVHVDDYDVTNVEALCEEDGKTYSIAFGTPVEQQLSVSSKYTITEKNKYGDEFSYDAYFMAKNETVSSWKVLKDGNESELEVSYDKATDGIINVSADAIFLDDIYNKFDDYSIITISTKSPYNYDLSCQINEAKGLTLYKKGEYTIKFVDRTGNSFSLIVDISGNTDWDSLEKTDHITYTELYNSVHLNKKSDSN